MQANLTGNIYGLRHGGGAQGDVYTSPEIVTFMLDLIGYTSDKDLSSYRVLEPSFGEGAYLIEIWHRLAESAKRFKFDASEVMSNNIYGCELDPIKYDRCVENLRLLIPTFQPQTLINADFLDTIWNVRFDYIVGNPPYIRYENILHDKINIYKNKFATFHYRSDLYILFYEHCLKHLSDKGIHCFVCSNRWLKNEYGKKLRGLIASSYNLDYIVDIENLEAFNETVLAYPSITLISNTNIRKDTQVVRIDSITDLKIPLSETSHKKIVCDNWDNLFLTEDTCKFSTIENEGFNIGIGVATGADKVFISSELNTLVEKELLLPLISAKDLSGNKFAWKGRYLLNPYTDRGSIIDIDMYPQAKQYLDAAKDILKNRHVVKRGRCWYSLIDKVKPDLLSQPKILLPDISGNTYIFVDSGNFYPAHNIYYIIGHSLEDLELLAAILMSDFVRRQIENISNKMNGGLPRWQSRTLRKIRIPKIKIITPDIRLKLIGAYRNRDSVNINSIVADIVKFQNNEVKPQKKFIPQSLFDYECL